MTFDIYFIIENDDFYYTFSKEQEIKKISLHEICNNSKNRKLSLKTFTKGIYKLLYPSFSIKRFSRLKAKIFIEKKSLGLYKNGIKHLFFDMKVFNVISVHDRDYIDSYDIENEIYKYIEEDVVNVI